MRLLLVTLLLLLINADAFFILGMGKRKIEAELAKSSSRSSSSSPTANAKLKLQVKNTKLRKQSASSRTAAADLARSAEKPGQTYPTLLPPKVKPTYQVINEPKGGLYVFEQVSWARWSLSHRYPWLHQSSSSTPHTNPQPFVLGVIDVKNRMSLLRLSDGHVAMHSPLAPTPECVAMVGLYNTSPDMMNDGWWMMNDDQWWYLCVRSKLC